MPTQGMCGALHGIIIAKQGRFTQVRKVVERMLLAVDVGNTHTVLGIYEGAELQHMWRIETNAKETADELRVSLGGLFQLAGFSKDDITGVVVATVVPALRRLWIKSSSMFI